MQQRQHSRWPWLAGFLSLVIVLTGALAAGANASKDQQAACANIERFNLEKQMNAHAAQILASCGRSRTGSQAHSTSLSSLSLLAPTVYGGPDVNEITGPPSGEGAFPHVTQSETQTWAQGNTVVTTMNDSRTAPTYPPNESATFHAAISPLSPRAMQNPATPRASRPSLW